jgi:hypothetical protein
MYKTLNSISHPYNKSVQESKFPYSDYWRNNPLSPETIIFPRMAGYRTYEVYTKIITVEPYLDKCNVYQRPCDVILPANNCYLKHRTIETQP